MNRHGATVSRGMELMPTLLLLACIGGLIWCLAYIAGGLLSYRSVAEINWEAERMNEEARAKIHFVRWQPSPKLGTIRVIDTNLPKTLQVANGRFLGDIHIMDRGAHCEVRIIETFRGMDERQEAPKVPFEANVISSSCMGPSGYRPSWSS